MEIYMLIKNLFNRKSKKNSNQFTYNPIMQAMFAYMDEIRASNPGVNYGPAMLFSMAGARAAEEIAQGMKEASIDKLGERINNGNRVYPPQPLAAVCQAWEYLTIELTGGQKLNEYGEEGWELVSVTSPSEDYFATAYFKRPLGYGIEIRCDDVPARK